MLRPPNHTIVRFLRWLWLLALGHSLQAAGTRAAAPDFRTFFGVARGAGEVVLSPKRGFRFDSPRGADVAFAVTSAALPMCYHVALDIKTVDVCYSGCRFGVFDEAIRYGGDNGFVNGVAKYVVSFHETKDLRRIYVQYYDREGNYHCWDGKQWREESWVPTGAAWMPGRRYRIVLTKGISEFSCEVRARGETCVDAAPVPVLDIRRGGGQDYLAFGDMVNDFVYGQLEVSSVSIEETTVRPYLETDVEHVVVRQAPPGRYAMYGGLTQLPEGKLFCVYKVGSLDPETNSPWTVRDETIVWAMSEDGGRTWSQDENVIYKDGATRQENCCGTGYLAGDGTIIHPFYILNADYEERAKEENWAQLHVAETRDRGATWRTRELHTPVGMPASFGGFVGLSDGTVVLNVYGAIERGTFRHEAGILRSTDDGKTWGDYSIIGERADRDGGPARLNETDLVELPSGKLLTMSRTQYPGFPLYKGMSADRGRTWAVGESGLTGLCPALCFSHAGPPEGTVVLVYHDRWGKHANKGGVYVTFSTDEGETWGKPMWVSEGAYPCLIEIEAGRMFMTYYRNSTLLRGTFFSVPFPSGLRVSQDPSGGLKIEWDPYRGKKAGDFSYRVFRSTQADVDPDEATPAGTCAGDKAMQQQPPSYLVDRDVQPGRVYFYRVEAHDGERRVGTSWVAAARAGGGR